MMRASIVLVSLVATATLASPALAQRGAPVPAPSTVELKPPAGWKLDADLSAGQASRLTTEAHLGGSARAGAAYFRSPTLGGAFVVSELVASPAPADVVAAARGELAQLHGVVEAAGGTLVSWKFDGARAALPEARLEWTSPSLGLTTITRALVYRTADSLVVVTGDCLLAADGAALRAPCEEALASLAPMTSLARVDVGLGTDDPAAAVATAAGSGSAAGSATEAPPTTGVAPTSDAPSMREGGPEIPTTIMVKPPASKPDRRPLMLLAGVAVLALVYFWNRRQKARLEAAEARERRQAERRGAGTSAPVASEADDTDEEDRAEGDAAERARDRDELAREAAREARDPDEPPVPGDDDDDGEEPDDVAREAAREARDPGGTKPGGKEGA